MFVEIVFTVIILFFSVVLHECAHGGMAYILGDPTAKYAGRLTLNPLKHIDPVGTIIFPGILVLMRVLGFHTVLLGWAKPVPVNFARLRNPRNGMIWVGLAGPATNILLAVVFSSMLKLGGLSLGMQQIIASGVFINLLLAWFNLIPIPPLDGSRLVMGILPRGMAVAYMRLEEYGMFIIIALLYFGLLDRIIVPLVVISGVLLGVWFQ